MSGRRKFIKKSAFTAGAIFAGKILIADSVRDYNLTQNDLFLHGVASGDPLSSQVIIWTKISSKNEKSIIAKWIIAADAAFNQVIQSGEITTGPENDFTVKLDIQHLQPCTVYYYQFISDGVKSLTGQTKTTASHITNDIQLAIVSCSDYSAGYYNALRNIAARKEIDAVIHLGDYIYEGTARSFDPQNNVAEDDYESTHFNRTRGWWLRYYRKRYSLNRLDPDLQAAHQAHPFITIWDDHEIANNAWRGGAQGHDEEKDGDWEMRKSAAKQAYAEWMPVRGNADKIHRSLRFGELAELIMLDTRIEGRDKQIYNIDDPTLYAADRSILGNEQKQWLLNQLSNSSCQWKLVATQVIFSQIDIKWATAGGNFANALSTLQNSLLDYWEGYPAERDEVMRHISRNKIDNIVFLSASMHCALAFDVTERATRFSRKGENTTYNPITGNGSIAVEFSAPSITSANFDEKIEKFYADAFQSMLNKKLPIPFNYNPNPHLKFANLQKHGYYILQLSQATVIVKFYFVDSLLKRSNAEKLSATLHTKNRENKLTSVQLENRIQYLLKLMHD